MEAPVARIHQSSHGIKLFAFDTNIVLIDQVGGQSFGCDPNVFGFFHTEHHAFDGFWHVAEKSKVWRVSGTRLMMASISSKKPILSISSASSKIKASIWSSFCLCAWSNLANVQVFPQRCEHPDFKALIFFNAWSTIDRERTLTPFCWCPNGEFLTWTANSRVEQ